MPCHAFLHRFPKPGTADFLFYLGWHTEGGPSWIGCLYIKQELPLFLVWENAAIEPDKDADDVKGAQRSSSLQVHTVIFCERQAVGTPGFQLVGFSF